MQAAASKKWREENPEKHARFIRRSNWKKNGIDPDAAEALWAKYKGKCGLCQEKIKGLPQVDHCHATKKVRDIICRDCNLGLGYFKDSPRLLLLADDYLKRHTA